MASNYLKRLDKLESAIQAMLERNTSVNPICRIICEQGEDVEALKAAELARTGADPTKVRWVIRRIVEPDGRTNGEQIVVH